MQIGFSYLPKDEVQAAKWYEAAAEQGEKEALSMIIMCCPRGIGLKQDHAAAARLLRQAAVNGDETAQANLKVLFQEFGAPYGDNDRQDRIEEGLGFLQSQDRSGASSVLAETERASGSRF